jgi:hypothetical protein
MSVIASNWYLDLHTFFAQTNIPILTTAHEIQFKIFLQPVSYIANSGGDSGTPVCTVNSASLIARITRLTDDQASQQLAMLSIPKQPMHYKFYQTIQTSCTAPVGTTSFTTTLSAFSGNISILYFVLRQVGFSQQNVYNFQQINSFSIKDASGANIVGGNPVDGNYNLLINGKDWTKSSYLTEAFSGTSNSFVYQYAFCVDPIQAHLTGAYYTSRLFTSNEQLQIFFNSALTTALQIDVFAYSDAIIEMTANSVTKLNA